MYFIKHFQLNIYNFNFHYIQVRYSCVVALSVMFVIRNTKYEVMEFLAGTANVARMMAAITSAVHGINTLFLLYLLACKWNDVVDSLRLLSLKDSMYNYQTKAEIKQVQKINYNQ